MDLSGVSERDFEERNKRFWQGKRFFLATFYLRVIVAPADLRFELWFKGKPYTSSIDPVTVEWDPAGASAKPMSHSTVWGTVKPSALRDSQIGMSSERRVGSTIQPQNLRDSIYTGDVQETQSLLESDFDSVAKDDFAWLRELKDLNYPERDIAELLINSEKDSPWIYFEPTANIDRSIIPGYHQPACVHFDRRRSPNSREIVGSPFTFANRRLIPTAGSLAEPTSSTNLSWSTDEESVMCIIDELCGIAGVCPDKRDLDKWTGQVLFSDDYPEMIASVTYRPNSKSLDTSQPSELDRAGTSVGHTESKDRDRALRDIVTVLERFCSAAAQSQQNGLCCDSFTILKKLRDTQGDAIDLTRVDLKLAVDLLDELKASRLDSDRNILPVSTAKSICELFLGSLSLGVHDIDATLDLCSLAAQLLTLGFALYARAHVDTFCPFFLDTPVYGVYLFGARDLSSGYPQAAVTLHRFTCLNDMIEKPVMVFSKFSDDVENSGAFPLDLLATSTDLLDTWGPGRFVEPPNRTAPESLSIIGILLGNGIIQPADEVGDPSNLTLHWSKEISPVHASAKKFTWNKDAKMRIAGSVIVNENCQADLKLLWPLFTQALENRGAYQDYWAFTEFQAGLAIAGQQFIGGQLQFNKTWTWHDGNSWKQNFLALLALDMPFDELERPWGLQVSFCTGVSRRVPLRVLLADVMPIFVQTLSLPPEWTVLEEQGIFKAFEGENLKAWLDSLNLLPKSQHLIPLVKRIVHYTLLILKDTGVDRTEQKFRIACPKNLVSGKPLAMCLEIPCNNGNLWTRILADTKDCATFACMTPLCLESEEHKCRQTDPWHCPSLQTAVCRYRAKDELLGVPVAGSPWRLQDQALYWIGNPKSGLQTRMKMSQDGKTARLHVSVSSMSEKTLSQLGTMRLLSKMGRKMDHIREKQYEDWEAEGVLVMADIKP